MKLLIMFFTLVGLSLKAQNISLINESLSSNTDDFYIENVVSSINSIGQVYMGKNNKVPLRLNGGMPLQLRELTDRKFKCNYQEAALTVEIEDLSFTEYLRSRKEIKGKAKMVLNFSHNNKSIYKAQSSLTYTRGNYQDAPEFFADNIAQLYDMGLGYLVNHIKENKLSIEAYTTGTAIEVLPFKWQNKGDTVFYHSKKLQWSDFQKRSPSGSNFAAAIYANIALDTKIGIKEGKVYASIQPKVFMLKNSSWSKKSEETAYALQHEQLHFDIALIIMGELIHELKALEANTVEDLNSKIQYNFLNYYNKFNRVEKQYDEETQHSINKNAQAYWQTKVQNELARFLNE